MSYSTARFLAVATITASCYGVTVNDFSNLTGGGDYSDFDPLPLAYFEGDWKSNDFQAPLASFVQQSGFYEIKGGTNSNLSYAQVFFSTDGTPANFGTINTITVSAQLLAGNAAPSFAVQLFNTDNTVYATATFLTSEFTSGGFTSVSKPLVGVNGYNFTSATAEHFKITGDIQDGTAAFNIAFNNIDVSFQAIPEPSTFATLLGFAAVGAFGLRRRPRKLAA